MIFTTPYTVDIAGVPVISLSGKIPQAPRLARLISHATGVLTPPPGVPGSPGSPGPQAPSAPLLFRSSISNSSRPFGQSSPSLNWTRSTNLVSLQSQADQQPSTYPFVLLCLSLQPLHYCILFLVNPLLRTLLLSPRLAAGAPYILLRITRSHLQRYSDSIPFVFWSHSH